MSEKNGVERTLVMIKPDAVERRMVEKIRQEIETKGLKITPVGFANFHLPLVQRFYEWPEIKCPATVSEYLCGKPIALWIIEGSDSTARMMEIKMRLRRELCSGDHRNLLHCSSSQARFMWEYRTLVESGMIKGPA